jgi:hypothetical protein
MIILQTSGPNGWQITSPEQSTITLIGRLSITSGPIRVASMAQTNPKSFRRQLLGQCPGLAMMNDLSDAAHHRFLDRPNDPARITVTSTAAYSQVNSAGGVQRTFKLLRRRFCQRQRRQPIFGVNGKTDHKLPWGRGLLFVAPARRIVQIT